MSPILACFLLLALTLLGGVLVYVFVVQPYSSVIKSCSGNLVLKYVTEYNSTHVVCYVVDGEVRGLVFNGTDWVPGVAGRGDLVIVSKEAAWIYMR